MLSSVLVRWANARLPEGVTLPDLHKIQEDTLADGSIVYRLVEVVARHISNSNKQQ